MSKNIKQIKTKNNRGFTRLVDFGFVFKISRDYSTKVCKYISQKFDFAFNCQKTKILKPKFTKGFTLVETLVAVGLFSVIMTMGVSALMTILGANAKAQNIKTAVNNVNFAVETISSALMTSLPDKIKCSNAVNPIDDSFGVCEENTGYSGIMFEKQTKTPPNMKYKIFFDGDNLMIKKGNILESVLIPASIVINNKEIFHVSTSSYSETKRIEIVLDGTTGSSARGTETTFNLQTGVTKLGQ